MQTEAPLDSRFSLPFERRMSSDERRELQGHHEHHNLFQRLFEAKGKNMGVEDMHAEGSIKRMEVPRDWHEVMPEVSRPGAPVGALKINEFHPPNENDVKLCYWNRGFGNIKEDVQTAGAFQRVLNQPPHHLSEQECDNLRPLIGNGFYANPDPYQILKAETRTVHGRNVLMVESAYRSNDPQKADNHSLSMFVSSDNSGQYTEQVYLVAPENKFAQYAEKAVQSMHSTKWRRPERGPF